MLLAAEAIARNSQRKIIIFNGHIVSNFMESNNVKSGTITLRSTSHPFFGCYRQMVSILQF